MPRLRVLERVRFLAIREGNAQMAGQVLGEDAFGRYQVDVAQGSLSFYSVWWDEWRGAWVGARS